MIRDLSPKTYETMIAGNMYNILPATIGMQAKIINYFEVLHNEKISWADLWKIFSSGDVIANSHLAYCMIAFKDKKPTYDEFLKLLEKKKTSGNLIENVFKTWHDALPKKHRESNKKKTMKKIITSLTIMSALISWVVGIVYLLKSF